ncbi:MAG: HvfB family MNIO-type RiPP peptide maturase [Gammaproteobacteria bacterium]
MIRPISIKGAGLGLRRAFLDALVAGPEVDIDFFEVAPENWIRVGGRLGKRFRALTERFPFVCHGLSLSLGSPAPLDLPFVLEIKEFLKTHGIPIYSEHLSYCGDGGHLYDLMPIPFTAEAVEYVAARIRRVQDILERRIAIENVSYYAAPGKEMEEIDFLNAVLDRADCDFLLDINNIYVNSINHRYDAEAFLAAIPANRIAYMHIAGHYVEAEDLIVDTHGAAVISPVWRLLEKAYQRYGVFPTLLERDFNIPKLEELIDEVGMIRSIQSDNLSEPYVRFG